VSVYHNFFVSVQVYLG